jgi:hypothetical protein
MHEELAAEDMFLNFGTVTFPREAHAIEQMLVVMEDKLEGARLESISRSRDSAGVRTVP